MGIKNWKEFKVGELFTLERGKEPSPKRVKDGVFPMINEINENNGIAKQGESESIFKKNAITISVNYASNVFYQPEEFIASVNILIIRNEYINKYTGLFLAGVLREKHKNYDYVNKISKERLENEDILLPATPSGDPDWDYMESYMKEMEEKAKERLDRLEEMRKQEKKKIDVSGWGEFKVGYIENKNQRLGTGLFEIVNSIPYHNKDIIEQEDGLNYITRSKFNNGLKCRVKKCDKFVINPAGTISFGAENANFFYQREEYITGNKMYYLDTQSLSEYSAMFLQSVLEETFSNNFSFSDGLIPTKIYDETILLPVTSAGDPDWAYMEQYMREMEEKAKSRIEKLSILRK